MFTTPQTSSFFPAQPFLCTSIHEDFQDNSNIIDYNNVPKRFNSLIVDIQELTDLGYGWLNGEGEQINEVSIRNSISFISLLGSYLNESNILPFIDPHPDGEVSLTWNKQKIGILNISFSANNHITFAGFFPKENKQIKGRLPFTHKEISDDLLKLIRKFKK